MNNVSLIEDKKSGGIFAAIVSGPKGIRVYGASGQGEAWATWANGEKLSIQEIEAALDTTLIVQKSKPANKIEVENLVGVFNRETLESFKKDISSKQLIQIIETKSDPLDERNEDFAFEMEHMYAEEENISNWPITDISLASIDVAYKQIAVQYKAKAFNLDRAASSMLIQVKGARAIWDPNMPGGGGYRCPDNTPNGGQFTNRIGTGCTFGVMRRIGRGIQSASLRDIAGPITGDESDAQLRSLYNLGRAIEQRGAKRQAKLQERFRRRVERRVTKLADKDKKRQGAPSFSQIYQALNPDMARRDRARIAVGHVMQRMGADISNEGFVKAQSRRLARKAPKTKKQPWTDDLDPSITAEQRRYGGELDTNYGGIFIPEQNRLYDFDSLVPNGGVIALKYGQAAHDAARGGRTPSGDIIDGEDENYPYFLSFDEIAKMRGKNSGQDEVDQIIQLVETAALAGGWQQPQVLSRDQVRQMRRGSNGEFVDMINLLNPSVPTDLRTPDSDGRGKDIPSKVSSLGHVVAVNDKGELVFWQNMQQMAPLSPYVRGDISNDFLNLAFARIFASPTIDGRAVDIVDGNPEIMVTPDEINNLYSVRSLKPDGTPYTLEEVLDNHISRLNDEGQVVGTGLKFSRISDKDFKKQFPRAWKNRNKPQSDWNKQNTTLANRLRTAANNIQGGTRRQNRRQNAQNIPQAQTTPQVPAAPQPQGTPSAVPSSPRQQRGASPRTGGIIQRFRENQNERLRRRTVAKRRTAKGRKPAPTDTRIERARKRLRRRANRLEEVPDRPEDYTSFSGGLPDPSLGLEGLIRQPGANQSDIPTSFQLDPATVDSIRRNFPDIDGAFNATADKSSGLYDAIEFIDRRSREGNGVEGILPSVEQFDVDYAGQINNEVDEVAKQISDVLQDDRLNNTERYRGAVLGPNGQQWFFVDGTLIAIADDANGIFHQFDMDGKNHLFSVISGPNNKDTVVASDYLRDKILGTRKRRSLRDRISSRRRVFAPGSPAAQSVTPAGGPSLRARTRTVIQDKTNPGFLFGNSTTGVKLLPSYQQADIDALIASSTVSLDAHLDRWRKRLGITDLSLPIDEQDVQNYLSALRKTDPKKAGMNANDWHNTLILAEVINNNDHTLIDWLKPQARLEVVTRANVQTDGTVNPGKSRTIGRPNIGGAGPTAPPAPPSTPGGGTPAPTAPRTPTPGGPSAPPSRPSPSPAPTPSPAPAPTPSPAPAPTPAPVGPAPAPVGPTPSTTPNPSGVIFNPNPTPTAPTPPANMAPAVVNPLPISILPPTGPDLEEGVGNPALGIIFDGHSGAYFDTTTGEFVEDTSGLQINESLTVPSKPIDESSTIYPKVKIFGGQEQLLVAPGVDTAPLAKQVKPKPTGTTSRVVTTGITGTFKQALEVYRRIKTGPRLQEPNRIPYTVKLDMSALSGTEQDRAQQLLQQIVDQAQTSLYYGPNPDALGKALTALEDMKNGTQAYTQRDVMRMITNRDLDEQGIPSDPSTLGGTVYLNSTRSYYSHHQIETGPLNKALQAQNAYRQKYLQHKADIDAGVPLDPADAAVLESLKAESATQWNNIAQGIIDFYVTAATSRDFHLASYRRKKTKQNSDQYLLNGAAAEMVKAILDDELANNPFALAAVGEAKKGKLRKRARGLNIRRKAIAQRLAGIGRRNIGLYDNDQDVLDPWKGTTPPPAPRTPAAINSLVQAHKTETLFEDAQKKFAPLTDEQILMLSQMTDQLDQSRNGGIGRARGVVTGPPGTPLESTEFTDGDGVGQGQLATIWYYNGLDSLPVAVNMDESIALLSEVDANGVPQAVAMTRGVKGTSTEQFDYINQAIRGDRYIPGSGGSVSGRGEYFSQDPNGWPGYHGGNGGTLISILTRDMNILSQDSFQESIDYAMIPALREIYEILGTPGMVRGVSADSPDKRFIQGTRMLPISAPDTAPRLTVDPVTGRYNDADLDTLQRAVDEITKVGNPLAPGAAPDGSWGKATLEATLGTSRFNERSYFPDTVMNATQKEIQEAIEQRDFYNKWAKQHMQWMIDLARSLQDESGPNAAQARETNERIRKAMSMLVHLSRENRASIMGVDAFFVDTQNRADLSRAFTREHAWSGYPLDVGDTDWPRSLAAGAAHRVLVMNRSGMIYYQDPVGHYSDWVSVLTSVVYPDGTSALRPGMRWS